MRNTLLLILAFYSSAAFCQLNSRVEADISIKEIGFDGTQSLWMGKVYYDIEIREMVYEFTFPEYNKFAITDNGFITQTGQNELQQGFSEKLLDFSLLNLILKGHLDYFGLKETPYELKNVSKEQDMVISEWKLPEEMGTNTGKILLSQKNKTLYGMVSFGPDDVLMSKQFFLDYQVIENVQFPTQLVQINYLNNQESKKITTYKNILFNNFDDEQSYRFAN